MKFPLPFITPQIILEAIGNEETIEFMDAVPAMEYTEDNAKNFMEFLKYTEKSDEELELGYCFLRSICTRKVNGQKI